MRSLFLFLAGLVLGAWLTAPVAAQSGIQLYALLTGAPKAIAADTNGYLSVHVN